MRYVALLGGVNVGGHRVKMEALRALFEGLGFAGVATFIASGNVIFESDDADGAALEGLIERRLGEALGYRVPTFIRTLEELRAVAAYEPFPPDARAPRYAVGHVPGRAPARRAARAAPRLPHAQGRAEGPRAGDLLALPGEDLGVADRLAAARPGGGPARADGAQQHDHPPPRGEARRPGVGVLRRLSFGITLSLLCAGGPPAAG